MAAPTPMDEARVAAFLDAYQGRELVRILTCGSVDDGKSTLLGRLLYDARGVFADQVAEAQSRSRRASVVDEPLDFSLLLDGLEAEREQGITIDVAHRYFTTARRKFIIADAPGHAQYTRNMATAASRADVAVILVDATRGVREQTRRHAFLAALLGVQHLVVAVNKMDLVGFEQAVFERIRQDCQDMLVKLGVRDVHWIPLSALRGDNVVQRSERMPWYQGLALLEHLETVHVASDVNLIDARFAVEYVVRTAAGFRGYAGSVVSGVLRPGDPLVVLPAGRRTRVQSVVGLAGELTEAFAPMSVTVTLADEVDVARGDVLAPPNNAPRVASAFEAMLVWMEPTALVPGRDYLLRQLARHVPARVTALRYRVDLDTLHRQPAAELEFNQIGRVAIATTAPLVFDAYGDNRGTGAFVLIDRQSHATVAAGTILQRQPAPTESAATGPAATTTAPGAAVWLAGVEPDAGRILVAALAARLRQRGMAVLELAEAALRSGLWADQPASAVAHARVVAVCQHAMASGLLAVVAVADPDPPGVTGRWLLVQAGAALGAREPQAAAQFLLAELDARGLLSAPPPAPGP